MDKAYYTSEKFIHDELLRRAERSVSAIPELWKKDQKIHSSLLLWPNDSVRTTTGDRFSGIVFAEIPASVDAADKLRFIKKATEQVEAYALLLVEEVGDCVRCVFESMHGTETWRLPIKDHGGVRVLGVAARRTNAESIGVLWQAN